MSDVEPPPTDRRSSQPIVRRRAPVETAAAAGIAYSVLAVTTLLIMHQVPDAATESEWSAWIDDVGHRRMLVLGLSLGSVAAVAFLWFVAVVRRRVGDRENGARDMCQFCVEHGEGERWYLQAKNYAYDLQSDLERRDYIVEFVQGFDAMRSKTIAGLELVGRFPEPVQRYTKSYFSKRQQRSHFGQPLTIEDCGKVFDLATSITVINAIVASFAYLVAPPPLII